VQNTRRDNDYKTNRSSNNLWRIITTGGKIFFSSINHRQRRSFIVLCSLTARFDWFRPLLADSESRFSLTVTNGQCRLYTHEHRTEMHDANAWLFTEKVQLFAWMCIIAHLPRFESFFTSGLSALHVVDGGPDFLCCRFLPRDAILTQYMLWLCVYPTVCRSVCLLQDAVIPNG